MFNTAISQDDSLYQQDYFFLSKKLESLGIFGGHLCQTTDETLLALKKNYQQQHDYFLSIIEYLKNQDKTRDDHGLEHFIKNFKEKNHGVYPTLCLFTQGEKKTSHSKVFGKAIVLEKNVFYTSTVTNIDLFEDYFREQLDQLFYHYDLQVYVGLSRVSIPFVFLSSDIHQEFQSLSPHHRALLKPLFHLPHLGEIHDDIPNGHCVPGTSPVEEKMTSCSWSSPKESSFVPESPSCSPFVSFPSSQALPYRSSYGSSWGSYESSQSPSIKLKTQPLMSFSALRVDYSLGRLKHYCGTSPEHFQHFILLTNYQRYIDEFFTYAQSQEAKDKGYTHWCEPKNNVQDLESLGSHYHRDAGHTFQMPAYHLMKPGKMGITIVNIGVSPSNAKTITDHLAVLRGHTWIMLGHCGGFDPHQLLGDYVLANNYMRADHVLDGDISKDIPIPIHRGIHKTIMIEAEKLMGPTMCQESFHEGTVLSTGNRNWELHLSEFAPLIHRSRSIAVDMESTTLGANAYRFLVPYATLLCISDRPLHGELKLHDNAKNFYESKVQHHLRLGIYTLESLSKQNLLHLHGENYRGIYGTPFR